MLLPNALDSNRITESNIKTTTCSVELIKTKKKYQLLFIRSTINRLPAQVFIYLLYLKTLLKCKTSL